MIIKARADELIPGLVLHDPADEHDYVRDVYRYMTPSGQSMVRVERNSCWEGCCSRTYDFVGADEVYSVNAQWGDVLLIPAGDVKEGDILLPDNVVIRQVNVYGPGVLVSCTDHSIELPSGLVIDSVKRLDAERKVWISRDTSY